MLDTVKDVVFGRRSTGNPVQYANPLSWFHKAFTGPFNRQDRKFLASIKIANPGSGKPFRHRAGAAAAGVGTLAVWSLFGAAAYNVAGNVAEAIQANMARAEQPSQSVCYGQGCNFPAALQPGAGQFMSGQYPFSGNWNANVPFRPIVVQANPPLPTITRDNRPR